MESRIISAPRKPAKRRVLVRAGMLLLALGIAGLLAWSRWVYVQIERYATQDQAAPADAIAVLGAAEYDGKPSPVYKARLDHAWALYHRGIAPLLITMGGPGGDKFTEGAVGREYLMSLGVPEEAIIAETESRTTEDAARRIAVIARTNKLKRLVIVSDGTHLFRIHAVCAADGLDVLTSPRPRVAVEGGTDDFGPVAHEIVSYTLWRLHLH
jgi:uncharacterized SAM-binding protein YcdF (DUF218 family)